jgi:putative aldouronate transport system substrate-binding protein
VPFASTARAISASVEDKEESFGASPFVTLGRDYGVWYDTITINSNKSIMALERGLDDNIKAVNAMYQEYIVPVPRVPVKDPIEMELEKTIKSNLDTYLEQKVTEFVTGKTPINDETHNEFIEQAKRLGVDGLVNIYNTAYERTLRHKVIIRKINY